MGKIRRGARKGTLGISPPARRVAALQADYERMKETFFGEPPMFDEMPTLPKQWETGFNHR
jgi:hypothetical protein